jgi:hypothetical protein
VIDVLLGMPLRLDPVPLLLAVLGGFALCVTAGFATPTSRRRRSARRSRRCRCSSSCSPRRSCCRWCPSARRSRPWCWCPGPPLGQLTQLAFAGGTWAPGLLGLPAVLPGVFGLVLWTVVFAVLARRNLRWDPRSS